MIHKIAFVGAGSMAEAIIKGIVKQEFIDQKDIVVTNHANQNRLKELHHNYGVSYSYDKAFVVNDADIIILAMKPADIEAAIQSIKSDIKPSQLLVSVAAGVEINTMQQLLDGNNPVIRAMPNTSASVGFSATAITKGEFATDEQLEMTRTLFNTIGITEVVSEDDMHGVTAISGSGPAYYYYFVEAMEKAAKEVGLADDVAKSLIKQTIVGAGEMLKQTGETAETLKNQVTSPGGTTEAGLKELSKHKVDEAILDCIKEARDRSITLGKN